MTRPLSEPSISKDVGRNAFETRQLLRRPIPPTTETPTTTSEVIVIQLKIIADDVTLSVGDGQFYLAITEDMDGMNLIDVAGWLSTVSSSGIPTIQIRNFTQSVDMLTTRITIDANEFNSKTAATPAVIDTANDDVAWADLLRIDVDVAGTGAKGLGIDLTFELPGS